MPATPFALVAGYRTGRVNTRSHMRLALALSLALHAVALLHAPYSSAPTSRDAPDVVLTVQLLPAAVTPAAASSGPARLPTVAVLPVETREMRAIHRGYAADNRGDGADAVPSWPARREQHPAPLVVAPTYYGLRDIDVLPLPIDPLPLLHAESDDGTTGQGVLRAEVFIDERGVVTDVHLREARVSAQLRRVTTEMFFATRFQPARKSGHAVASRIDIGLLYGSVQVTAN